jgi:hypothetical protein
MRSMREIATIGVIVFLLGAGPVLADCYHNGKPVPEGTRIGVLVCENGKWVEKR